MDCDAVVVGAGVAGLASTAVLAQSGMRVLCLEASGRVGGRIYTVRDPLSPVPVELGAEFVHGRPRETCGLPGLTLYGCQADAVQLSAGRVLGREDASEPAGKMLAQIRTTGKDRTIGELLAKSKRSAREKRWIAAYLEGFNAARKERASASALKRDAEAAESIGGDTLLRVAGGYDSVPLALLRWIPDAERVVRLRHVVERVKWSRNRVEVSARCTLDGRNMTVRCRRIVITVPLGVLQLDAGAEGAIEVAPAPAVLREARRLAVGQVYRVTFRFPEVFWEQHLPQGGPSFAMSTETVFPTWWTTEPMAAPLLTGWSAGPAGDALRGLDEQGVVREALASLSRILGRAVPSPSEAYFHDWFADPYFRGAYSYVPVNAQRARAALARPVENTLFFAGEATNAEGHSATVHGAIATGYRAAGQVLKSVKGRHAFAASVWPDGFHGGQRR